MGAHRAAAGTLALAGVTYYMWPTPEFNHNVASTPFWAAITLMLWRAVDRGALLHWILLGAGAAGALYAKLSAVFLLVPVAAYILTDASARARLATPGPWFGLTVFIILVIPLVHWLLAHDFAPLRYATRRSLGLPVYQLPLFLLDTTANVAGILVMLGIASLLGPRRGQALSQGTQQKSEPEIDARGRGFLLFFTIAPVAFAVLAALLSHAGLKTAWGSSMFNSAGLLAVALTASRYTLVALHRIALTAAVLLIVVPLGYGAVVTYDAHQSSRPGMRVNWPQRAIAERLGEIWARETGQPLRIVAGNPWLAALVGLTNKDLPSILTNGDATLSPWISSDRIEREGLLAVWDGGSNYIPEALLPLIATATRRQERFGAKDGAGEREFAIGYAIVPPKGVRAD
jgi:hypothetical protein